MILTPEYHQTTIMGWEVYLLDDYAPVCSNWSSLVNGFTNDIDDASQRLGADGDADGGASVNALLASDQTFCTVHGNCPNCVLTCTKDHVLRFKISNGIYSFFTLHLFPSWTLESPEVIWKIIVFRIEDGDEIQTSVFFMEWKIIV